MVLYSCLRNICTLVETKTISVDVIAKCEFSKQTYYKYIPVSVKVSDDIEA